MGLIYWPWFKRTNVRLVDRVHICAHCGEVTTKNSPCMGCDGTRQIKMNKADAGPFLLRFNADKVAEGLEYSVRGL